MFAHAWACSFSPSAVSSASAGTQPGGASGPLTGRGHEAPRPPEEPPYCPLATGQHGYETGVRAGARCALIAGAVAPPHYDQRAAAIIRAGARDPRSPETVNSPSAGQLAARHPRWPPGRGRVTPDRRSRHCTPRRPAGRGSFRVSHPGKGARSLTAGGLRVQSAALLSAPGPGPRPGRTGTESGRARPPAGGADHCQLSPPHHQSVSRRAAAVRQV